MHSVFLAIIPNFYQCLSTDTHRSQWWVPTMQAQLPGKSWRPCSNLGSPLLRNSRAIPAPVIKQLHLAEKTKLVTESKTNDIKTGF